MTDREAMKALGFSEPNSVRPRLSELLAAGLVREVGHKVCRVTGKRVRLITAME